MDSTTLIVVIGALALSVGGGVFYYRRRNKEVQQMFEQISESAKQIPKQKKQSFILLMFKESILASKKKTESKILRRISDPKQLEVQLIQMDSILKDRSRVKDKQMKRTLQMFDSYIAWEKKTTAKSAGKA